MKSVQLTKKLNNTELGKAGTHDTYILVPQEVDIEDIFPDVNTFYDFIDRETGEKVSIRRTQGREKRIVGLGPYYSEKDLCAGDEIILEKRDINGSVQRYIDYYKQINRLMLQKSSVGFEMLTPDRKNLIEGKGVSLDFWESRKKRQDSPDETDFYDLKVDGISFADQFSNKEIVEIEIANDTARLNKFCAWKREYFEMEEQ